jgi:signal transduction histidine kinase
VRVYRSRQRGGTWLVSARRDRSSPGPCSPTVAEGSSNPNRSISRASSPICAPCCSPPSPRRSRSRSRRAPPPWYAPTPTQLRQVALNLVINAAEAIGDATGTIHLRTGIEALEHGPVDHDGHRLLGSGTYAFLEVEDTGPGIEPELHERLFDPFYTTKFTGRGLGLAASQGIARAHGGLITVHSRPGAGARFRVHLPASR